MIPRTSFDPAAPALGAGAQTPPEHDARDMVAGGNLAHIRLDDQVYTLRITRAGKLILTK